MQIVTNGYFSRKKSAYSLRFSLKKCNFAQKLNT